MVCRGCGLSSWPAVGLCGFDGGRGWSGDGYWRFKVYGGVHDIGTPAVQACAAFGLSSARGGGGGEGHGWGGGGWRWYQRAPRRLRARDFVTTGPALDVSACDLSHYTAGRLSAFVWSAGETVTPTGVRGRYVFFT